MTYITQQGLIDRFGATELIQLTDRTNKPASTIDASVVELHIADAASVINSYIGKVYSLPLAVVTDPLPKVAADLARYFLHGKAADKDSPVAQAYRDAIAWLEKVSKGLVIIENAGTIPAQPGGGQIRTSRPDRVFTRDSMGGF